MEPDEPKEYCLGQESQNHLRRMGGREHCQDAAGNFSLPTSLVIHGAQHHEGNEGSSVILLIGDIIIPNNKRKYST